MMMQGYDAAAAVPFIAKAMRKAGHREPQAELEDFIAFVPQGNPVLEAFRA